MDRGTENAPLSDTEGAERPVREQLKKASIAGVVEKMAPEHAKNEAVRAEGETVKENGEPVSLHRKRSFEEVEGEDTSQLATDTVRHHVRKRSRDSATEEELRNVRKTSGESSRGAASSLEPAVRNGDYGKASDERPRTPSQTGEKRAEAAAEAMASPKTKRSRLHSTTTEENGAAATQESKADTVKPDPQAASHATGFANTSAISPFNALAGSKSPSAEPQTSQSAFASSGFSALASSTSGFGAIGKSSGGFGLGGSFGSGPKSPPIKKADEEKEKPKEASSSTFGGALGQKSAFAAPPTTSGGFGSSTSGFGKLGSGATSGFGGSLGSGSAFGGSSGGGSAFAIAAGSGGLTSFASGKPSTTLASSSKAIKPFGASADDDEEGEDGGEDDGAGYRSPALSQEEDKQDERFHEQQIETGEEEEQTEYSCRAKLYHYAQTENGKKEWRERGLGVLRLNVKQAEGDEKVRARILMRADGSHRVVLNTPIEKKIKFGGKLGGPPEGGLILFAGTIDGKPGLETLQLKVCWSTYLPSITHD
ncbi:hypothetical protein BAUCODRAFT_75922 [Baudoinia panamericana UAMH 10762]|uniref:RanBD1 domain-containing protein n=1 Tax=Baudoinia panamericana (strain UAMH 10762) TaxID=717646 RepID=M2MPZ9_BAUPA|nr:uncharacterized protein BAUCODRAFT_75922 [Baudoinia panamericana UAMH 10762]EMC93518.1 hypothetical protein BAUCODRAFT_75922 [Baudoinia panamericana UAMH 10762]